MTDVNGITCYDGVTVSDLPEGGGAYLAYVNRGEVQAIRARFPRAKIIPITTDPTLPAQILDIERGAAVPEDYVGWYHLSVSHGFALPGAYASKDNSEAWDQVARIAHTKRQSIVADWTGEPHFVDGRAGCQYKNTPGYDVSILKPGWKF
jgi:hypothetical protein